MIKVDKLELKNCKNLLDKDNPSFSGVVLGYAKGLVWTDDIQNPSVIVAYSPPVGGFNIMGSYRNGEAFIALTRFLEKDLFVMLRSKGISDFEFSVVDEKLQQELLAHFSDKEIQQEKEFFYKRTGRIEIMDVKNYPVHPIEADIIEKVQNETIDNAKMLQDRIDQSWGSYEVFQKYGYGFVVTYENAIVGVILGTSRYENILPIDIEVDSHHRKKGLASLLTQHFVNACAERDLIPQWNCVESNIASSKTAEKIGFQLLKKKSYYWFDI